MRITIPYIDEEGLDYAFDCLELCKRPHAKEVGYEYPYFTPGGDYAQMWWLLDSALALAGYKWKDHGFAEISLQNFIDTQKENGRIGFYGHDMLPCGIPGEPFVHQKDGASSLPKLFDVAYHILQGTDDTDLVGRTYAMLKAYADWWYQERRDPETGLMSAVFEETFIPYYGCAMEYAPVDTNVEVYVGLIYTARLGEKMGENDHAALLRERAKQLKTAIQKYLWVQEKGAFYPYDLVEKQPIDCLMASTFYPLRMQIANAQQQKMLLTLLQDHQHFNWDTIPLTSVSKKDPIFKTPKGHYQGNASWSGNVWTLINETVVRGLIDCNEKKLAAELAMKTVRAFHRNCAEFINPFDGTGQGVLQYAWSAAQYITLIIEVIFGIHIDGHTRTVTILPNLTEALKREELSITGLTVLNGVKLDVWLRHAEVAYAISDPSVKVICPSNS